MLRPTCSITAARASLSSVSKMTTAVTPTASTHKVVWAALGNTLS